MNAKTILFMMLFCPIFIFGQVWEYPIKPGTKEWKSLNSNKEKVIICQIPQNVMDTISTNNLLELCIKYPLLNDICAFNNSSEGLNKLMKDFNGIRELFSRKDIGEILLSKYSKELDSQYVLGSNRSDIEKGKYIVLISTLELLLSVPEIQNQSSLLSKKKIMSELWRGYEIKKTRNNYFKGIGFKTNFLARGQVLSFVEGNKKLIDSFSIGNYDDKFIETINTKTLDFINK